MKCEIEIEEEVDGPRAGWYVPNCTVHDWSGEPRPTEEEAGLDIEAHEQAHQDQ